jgi:Zn-dependent peptidase ImmA (M78 family)/DNA-binding XRE family transcriptional regulator
MENFSPGRLDLARRRRGLTKGRLAARSGVSARSLLAYERGEADPTGETLQRLAGALEFPPAFFVRPEVDEPSVDGVSFRARSAMTARQRDQAISAASLATELVDWIGERFELPPPAVPALPDVGPEVAAEQVRAEWGLGQQRIPNIVHLLEQHGVRVLSLAEEYAEVDAFSFWRRTTPYVFLNTMKSAERSRMDATHELGHLVMHLWGGPEGREAESEAHAFASAFLMPRRSVIADAPQSPSVAQIVRAKKRWNVSAMALAHRMKAVGMLSEWHARSLFIEMSKRGYRTREPNEGDRETSQVLGKVFAALRQDGESPADVASELAIPKDELTKLIFGLIVTAAPALRGSHARGPSPIGSGAGRPLKLVD